MVIEVAAAVIQRADGAFLLGQRPAGKVYAGYWEFPGGKIEAGEPPSTALARELREELGIDVERAYPWITRVFTYPHGTVRLRFFRVVAWRGEPHPREGQRIAWQRIDAPMAEPMLPANAPVLASLALPAVYGVTDAARFDLSRVEQAMQRGLRLLQVREPGMGATQRAQYTRDILALARRHGCRVLTKESVEGADGIHFPARELMALKEKPSRGLAAASCHTRGELERAMALDLDFAVVGPVLEKPSEKPLGWPGFAALVKDCTLPVYAIGGLTERHLEDAWRAGAHGVAMIRGAWDEKGSEQITRNASAARPGYP